ncbi:uncharacterized protein BO88DRAFT_383001 [Aspergillus vadensis CBS 113365]|uniref:Pal1-domain-containing protein n=1 Tax=Aspergillus vadensis (strain CBS 113365 / IMI 142717 / IBT 24658) TaxID=1448311 RepID=A0A319BJ04_ASPVC|nr:hypothetical protein BO88DRAFT_383001 [Aspergillus vadensis CBS 113365]PYH72271.1 hypothetical protein BO88DRAFT_383001 [Aspergillus vadensis CBS 113365]
MASAVLPACATPYRASYAPRYAPNLMDMGVEMDSYGSYQRFHSPSPSRRSLNRQRSTSFPSVYYSGSPEHHPVEPRRKKESSSRRRRHGSPSNPQPARYSRNSMLVNPDVIDRLDSASLCQYHHEGPYDAVYAERNYHTKQSPVEAVKDSTAETLKATPKDKIRDCIDSHRPLDGVAYYPPGHTDMEGRTYEYEEGPNMMNDYGNFMRCPGQKFTDEDFKKDPFYNTPHPKPFASLRKALSIRRRKRSGTS